MKNLKINTLVFFSKQLLCVTLLCLTFSCSYGERLKGNKIMAKEERTDIKNFDKIRISVGLTAEITQGNKEFIEVEAEQNLLQYLITEVKSNNTLYIHWKKGINIRKYKKAVVHITLKSLKEIHASSAGSIKSMNTIKTGNLTIDVSSASNVNLTVLAENITIDASSAANVKLKGQCNNITIDASSASEVETKKLQSQNAIVDASSAAEIEVYALNAITANASSGGDIEYYGNPKNVSVKTSSGGDIDKKQ